LQATPQKGVERRCPVFIQRRCPQNANFVDNAAENIALHRQNFEKSIWKKNYKK